jgi:hypothetical protein
MNKWLLWGGAGAAALVGGFLLLRGGAQPAASSSTDTSASSGYYPPVVYGSGSTSIDSSGSSGGTTTDNSIAQLIASNLATAQEQSSLTRYTSDNEKAIALANYGSQATIAQNDNATKLAMQQDQNKADIQKALAGQLGALSATFGGTKTGLVGAIGYANDAINVSLNSVYNSTTGRPHN